MNLNGLLGWLDNNDTAVTALSAVVMVLVTTVSVVFNILLWAATRRQAVAAHEQASLARQQAELTRQIFEATHRPELSAVPIIMEHGHPGMVRVNFTVTNHGRMTAVVTQWSAVLTYDAGTLGAAAPLTGVVVVFPGASVDTWPHIEVQGVFAPILWKTEGAQATLHIEVTYRAPAGPTTYRTETRGAFRMTGALAFSLQQVEHNIT